MSCIGNLCCFPEIPFINSWGDVKNGTKKVMTTLLSDAEMVVEVSWAITKETLKVIIIAISDIFLNIIFIPIYLCAPRANTVFSQHVILRFHNTLTVPTIFFRERLTGLLPPIEATFVHGLKKTVNYSEVLAVGISEELVFRGLIQGVLLRKLPQMAIKKLSPGYEDSVDHKIVKIARVLFASALFALAHAKGYGNCPGFLLPQFVIGLVFSTMYERNYSLAQLSMIHFTYDAICMTIAGGFPEGPVCP